MPVFEQKVAKYGPRLMRDLALADFQAAAVFGNAGHESLGLTTLQEIKPVVKGSRGGYGWFQWTGPRRRAFEAWCSAHKLDPASDEANYGFLCFELGGTEAAALKALRATSTLSAATQAVCEKFERPGVVALAKRQAWAERALKAIRAGAAIPVLDAVPVTPAGKPGFLARLRALFA
jgi:hypothetical protein